MPNSIFNLMQQKKVPKIAVPHFNITLPLTHKHVGLWKIPKNKSLKIGVQSININFNKEFSK